MSETELINDGGFGRPLPKDPTPFDLGGSLPTGTTVLEASAGTGKTFTIAALAARYIADGVADLSQVMMVTFGRMATDELRLRIRERLARSERHLAIVLRANRTAARSEADDREADGPQTGGSETEGPGTDAVDRLLAEGTGDEIRARQRRLRAALADFDTATIATTHEFCQAMQAGLGVLGDHDPGARFTESLSELTREVAADCYLRRFAALDVRPSFGFDEAVKIADAVVRHAPAALVPSLSDLPAGHADSPVGQRVAFGQDVRAEVERRKQRSRLYGYEDMLTGLRDALADPESGPRAAERVRQRYRIVLVDEFQDTDPVQWDILRRAFHGHSTLILIGDPKQAIYAFRGADVYSYLQARADADALFTLDTNWRSDAQLVRAQQAIMGGTALGDSRIVVRPVRSAHPEPRLRLPSATTNGSPAPSHSPAPSRSPAPSQSMDPRIVAPVRIRLREHDPSQPRFTPVGRWRPQVAIDLARDIATLLSSGAEVCDDLSGDPDEDKDQEPSPSGEVSKAYRWRRITPGDIAVLVRQNARLEPIKTALDDVGVPAVIRGARSVFCSTVAQEWRRLLVACEQPRQALIREVALTSFIGWDIGRLAAADEDDLNRLSAQIRRWSRVLAGQGVAALVEAVTEETQLAARLLSTDGGERLLTDLRHVGQSLHAAQTLGQLGIGALLAWLSERITEADQNQADELSRRLETDAEAVQILTIHRSKGLEFPVVYLPEAWDRWVPDDDGQVLQLHAGHGDGADADGSTRPQDQPNFQHDVGGALDIGGALGPGRRDRLARSRQEEAGEDLRVYYVALTRARSQIVTWWLPSANTARSALQRFLFRARGDRPGNGFALDGTEPLAAYEVTGDPGSLASLNPSLFSIELMAERPPIHWRQDEPSNTELSVRRFNRNVDLAWRRTSYSSLTAAAHGLAAAPAAASDADPRSTAVGPTPDSPNPTASGPAAVDLGVGSEPDFGREDDEFAGTDVLSYSIPRLLTAADAGLVSPMGELPMGTQFGTVVHALLEQIDPEAEDLSATLTALAADELSRGPAGPMTPSQLGPALVPALQTPLGPLALERRLCDIPVADRLPELTFELPLAGGEQPNAELRLEDLRPVLERHLGPGDPLHAYPAMLALPGLAEQPLRGYLNGSIDAVLRVRPEPGRATPTSRDRYLVVDYKTNWLGDPDVRPLPVTNYTPELMATAMMHAHYPLQALLYSVALHRYLRWRQPHYDPETHLGGVLYLFLRGMAGAETPRFDGLPCGVFSWRPPGALITELSDLLDGRR